MNMNSRLIHPLPAASIPKTRCLDTRLTRFATLLALILTCPSVSATSPTSAASAAGEPDPSADVRYVFGLSPFLARDSKDPIFRHIVRFILEDAPSGSSIHFLDGFGIQTISQFEIPRRAAFSSPKTRATQFREPIQRLRSFLAADPLKPEPSKGLDFSQALHAPRLLDFIGRNLAATNHTLFVSLFGSPLHQDGKEPGFSMARGYFPSDGHLLASRDASVYGLEGRDHALDGVVVHWAYSGDPWMSDLHREKISRFWALYVQRQGGRLRTFTGDLPTAFAALRGPSPAVENPVAPPAIDPAQTKVEMLRITRDIGSLDWIAREEIADAAQSPPVRMTGPMKIGIRWKGDIDLDLYARPGTGRQRLYFEHPRSPEGYYEKDHRSSPGRDYEFIEFEEPVDVREVQASINFYDGASPGGPEGEVRIEFEGRIYTSPFAIAATHGNRGREGAAQSRHWAPLNIQRILHLPAVAAN
ncbi:MAG: hypothetical protein AB7O66_05100 [Limisphaerales bacterium]